MAGDRALLPAAVVIPPPPRRDHRSAVVVPVAFSPSLSAAEVVPQPRTWPRPTPRSLPTPWVTTGLGRRRGRDCGRGRRLRPTPAAVAEVDRVEEDALQLRQLPILAPWLQEDLQVAWPATAGVPTTVNPRGRLPRGCGPPRSLAGRGLATARSAAQEGHAKDRHAACHGSPAQGAGILVMLSSSVGSRFWLHGCQRTSKWPGQRPPASPRQ